MEQQHEPTDQELLQRLIDGNKKAFSIIYHRHYDAVANVGMRYLADRKLTEDLVQEVFTKLWVNRMKFKNVENFQFYFYTMVKHDALQYIKNIARESAAKENVRHIMSSSDNNIDRILTENDHHKMVSLVIAQLPIPHQRVFNLIKVEGTNRTEAARILNLSQQTVDNYLVFALRAIRERLKNILVPPYWIALMVLWNEAECCWW